MSTVASDTAHLDFTDRGHAIVVIGGHPPDRRVLGELPLTRDVICADSGLDHALRLGLVPSTVIGDMDSVDPHSLATARASGCTIIEHSTHKDATDTELALAHAVAMGHRRVTLLWGGGDRIDHVLGVIAALAHPSLAHLDGLRVWLASDRMDIVHSGKELIIEHEPRTVLSLMPIGPRSAVVTTRGLQWELDRSALSADSARGVSNVVIDSPCSIRSDDGVTAVVTPGLLEIRNGRTRSVGSLGAQR
jgi:thiamine pyrophosphokinase